MTKCKDCKFSFMMLAEIGMSMTDRIECRRYPPITDPEDGYRVYTIVRPDDWCGEFKEKVDE